MTAADRPAPKAYAALAVGIVAIGWSAIFVRWASIPGPASAFYRVLIAALLLWPYLLLRQRTSLRFSGKSLRLAALGGVFFAGDLACYNTAVLRGSATNAVLLGNNAPVVVGLLTWIVLGRAPRGWFWTGLLVAMGGAFLIVGRDLMRTGQAGSAGADLLAVLASAFFAGYLMVTERVRSDTGTTALLSVSLAASTVCLGGLDLALGISLRVPSGQIWAALAGVALVSQLLGYFSLTYALGHLPATLTSVTLLAQAPVTAVLAYFLLGERFGRAQAGGGLLVLAGIWMVNTQPRSQMRLLNGE